MAGFDCGNLRVNVKKLSTSSSDEFYLDSIEINLQNQWHPILLGINGNEFATSIDHKNAQKFQVLSADTKMTRLGLSCESQTWSAREIITLNSHFPQLQRAQTYRFHQQCDAAIHPGFTVPADENTRYTYSLHAYEAPLHDLEGIRSDISWALPFPFHVWHARDWVAIYGVDPANSRGTIDFKAGTKDSPAMLGIYYPDTAKQDQKFYEEPEKPGKAAFPQGTELTLTETIGFAFLSQESEPLLEAIKKVAKLTFQFPQGPVNFEQVANGIANYYPRCKLWARNALGWKKGWFRNMWTHTQRGMPRKEHFFDFGWGEGNAVELCVGLVRNWQRTKNTSLLSYVNSITKNMESFKRRGIGNQPYYDRYNGKHFGDFSGRPLIWSHSLGHTGNQLLKLYLAEKDYPCPEIRAKWFNVARDIANYFAEQQKSNGDIPDILDENNQEMNRKSHRISARAVVCGLWVLFGTATKNPSFIEKGLRLMDFLSAEINKFEYYNSMIDGMDAKFELTDGESAFYVLEGLTDLYKITQNQHALALCKKVIAYACSWIYFYDLPKPYSSITRGGQVCRMPDFPLIFPGGTAKGIEPMLILWKSTGDEFYLQMVDEMLHCIASYQLNQPSEPWHGAIVHAIEQYSGKHWGPDKEGQVDTGMSTGNSLAAIEYYLSMNMDPATNTRE